MRTARTDLLVVGSGLAGLACALAWPGRCTIVTKTEALRGGSSWWAKGGISAAVDPDDSPELHAADTRVAAAGIADADAVARILAGGPALIRRLVALGVPFDRSADGTLALGREAAHGRHRVVHARGDSTGAAVVDTLVDAVERRRSIERRTGTMILDLVRDATGRAVGIVAVDGEGPILIESPCVVLATGGIGGLYLRTSNPPESTGDGLAAAARAGAMLADLEFVQFHPTALCVPTADGAAMPLLTEALRGAGARLMTADGRHLGNDLAPRDVVARMISRARAAGDDVLLDLRPALAARGEAAFPSTVHNCRSHGLDPATRPVPVVAAAHFHMGGVATDWRGRTSLPGLWACGEVASTGLHGANRLASNALLEALLMGEAVASDAVAHAPAIGRIDLPSVSLTGADLARDLRRKVRACASAALEVERDGPALTAAETTLAALHEELNLGAEPLADRTEGNGVRAAAETRNLALVARLVARAASRRTESRGGHWRRDWPEPRPAWAHRQMSVMADLHSAAGEVTDDAA